MCVFSQVIVRLVKGKFEVVEEVGDSCHPPVLQQVHRPQDEVDSLTILIPGPQKEYTEYWCYGMANIDDNDDGYDDHWGGQMLFDK